MKTYQLVETTQDRYKEHVLKWYECLGKELRLQAYSTPEFSQYLLFWKRELIAIEQKNRDYPEHSQYFVLQNVAMGVHTAQIGLNNQEVH